jgi:CHAT domain-containing protein/Flp pilus assembly protein TadD
MAGRAMALERPLPPLRAEIAAPGGDLLEQGRRQFQAGQIVEAIGTWTKAAAEFERRGDAPQQALSLSYLSLAYQERAQWQHARRSLDQSLKIVQTGAIPAQIAAQVLNTDAGLLFAQGQPEAALERWQQAQTQYDQAGDTQGSLGSQINQAQAMQHLGFYRRARQQLEQVNQRLSQLPDSPLKVTGGRTLGIALQSIGDPAATEVLTQSLTLAQKLQQTQAIAPAEQSVILLGLGKQSASRGEFDQALEQFEQAERVTQNPTEQLQARMQQLQLLIQQGQSSESVALAKGLAQQVQQQLQQVAPSRSSLYTAINLVTTLNELPEPARVMPLGEMAQLMQQVVAAAQQIQDPPTQAYALNQWGKLYARTGQLREAQTVTEQALHLARSRQADNIIAQSAWQMGRLARQQGDRRGSIAAYQEAIQSLQAIRGDLMAVHQDVQFSYRESVEPVYRELVALLLEGQPSQAELIQARDVIESLQVAELDNFFREACLDKTRQIDQVDPTATVIYPIILPDRLAVIASTPGQPLGHFSVQQSQVQTEAAIGAMYRSLSPVADKRDRLRTSQQLYDWLIRPAENAGALKQAKTLVFVLDGRLRSLPMAALHDGERYLIEKQAVTLSPGLQLMASRGAQASQTNLLIGGISSARSGFAALPGVETEIKAIAQTANSSTLLNQQFTGPALAEKISTSNADVVHLATHGQFSSRLEDTFLLTWDGRVNVKDLSQLLRSREGQTAIELLVLSACDTASGDDRAALGLAGLAVKSGARSTIATLWPIKDQAAATLMGEFYRQWKNNPHKAEALRQAQLHLLRNTDFKEPFFWSGVVLVGNWQ